MVRTTGTVSKKQRLAEEAATAATAATAAAATAAAAAAVAKEAQEEAERVRHGFLPSRPYRLGRPDARP